MTAARWHLVLTAVVWLVMGATLYWLLETLKLGCQLQERGSGLWAECFSPAAIIFTGLFAAIFVVDLIRTVFAYRKMRACRVREAAE